MDIPEEKATRIRQRLERLVDTRYRFARRRSRSSGKERGASPPAQFVKAPKELLLTQRVAMIEENRAGRLDDVVLRKVLRELDLEELDLEELSNSLTNRMS